MEDYPLAFRRDPPNSRSLSAQVTAVVHLIRNPVDVVLGFRESALTGGTFKPKHTGWLNLHLMCVYELLLLKVVALFIYYTVFCTPWLVRTRQGFVRVAEAPWHSYFATTPNILHPPLPIFCSHYSQ
jgi:hypothetical protein